MTFSSQVLYRHATISSVPRGPAYDVYDWPHKGHLNVMLVPPLIFLLL
jgi:hypothetical protein